jgi:hypothetical protein
LFRTLRRAVSARPDSEEVANSEGRTGTVCIARPSNVDGAAVDGQIEGVAVESINGDGIAGVDRRIVCAGGVATACATVPPIAELFRHLKPCNPNQNFITSFHARGPWPSDVTIPRFTQKAIDD